MYDRKCSLEGSTRQCSSTLCQFCGKVDQSVLPPAAKAKNTLETADDKKQPSVAEKGDRFSRILGA